MATLVAAYGARVGDGISEFTEEQPITDEPGPKWGKAAFTRKKEAPMFKRKV